MARTTSRMTHNQVRSIVWHTTTQRPPRPLLTIAFAIVSKYAFVALKDLSPRPKCELLLYVIVDTKTWAKAQFLHASSAKLRENMYTMLESTTHSLAIDVVLQKGVSLGTLSVSNSNGTFSIETVEDTTAMTSTTSTTTRFMAWRVLEWRTSSQQGVVGRGYHNAQRWSSPLTMVYLGRKVRPPARMLTKNLHATLPTLKNAPCTFIL
jgi:hypothetical protein